MSETSKKKSVAIVGFASSSRDLAPYNDPNCEIWLLNELYRSVPRWDRLFEVHKLDYLKKFAPRDGTAEQSAHYEFLKSLPGPGEEGYRPVYMLSAHAGEFKATVVLDPFELAKHFMYEGEQPYFTSTPAYMLALALAEGFTDIGIYGIDLLQDEEYAYQRPCMEWLIGWGRGNGRRIFVPKPSALLKANYLYGVTEPPDAGDLQPIKDFLVEQLNKHQAQFNQAEATRHTLSGVGQALQEALKMIAGLPNPETYAPLKALIEDAANKYQSQFGQADATRHTLNGVNQGLQAVVSWIDHRARGGSLGTDKVAK